MKPRHLLPQHNEHRIIEISARRVRIPPLRERREDIPLLATAFLERASQSSGHPVELSDDAMKALLDYDWPGNVRELENCLERCCAMSSGPVIHIVDLPSAITGTPVHLTDVKADGRILPVSEVERRTILGAIAFLSGDKLRAAKLLGIGKTTLYRKLKSTALSFNQFGKRSFDVELSSMPGSM